MDELTLCNTALGLIGHTVALKSLQEPFECPEARSCARILPECIELALSQGQWSFARRDEVITSDYLTEFKSYPWRFTYTLPDDVGVIFSLTSIKADSRINTFGFDRGYLRFDIRNIDDRRYLVTDCKPDFVIHYQTKKIPLSLCPPMFVQGIEYIMASKLAPEFVKSEVGHGMGLDFFQTGLTLLQNAQATDLNQGAYSQRPVVVPKWIKVRS